MPELVIRDLRVHFPISDSHNGQTGAVVRAVDGVSFRLAAGESLAIIGETGSGKTTIARAILGLHPPGSVSGSICLGDRELLRLSEAEWRPIRWQHVALAVQNAGTAFDPVYRLGDQIAEPLREHLRLPAAEAWERAEAFIQQVGLKTRHLYAYPHQLSGGEKQRAVLAMALSCDPEILIVDEPTRGQDVLSRARLIDLLQQVRTESGVSLLLISHDLAAVAQLAGQVAVLYAGKIIESGSTADILEFPRHPYTWGLDHAYPNMTTARDLRGIRGQLPDPADPPPGCRFQPRCTQAVERCRLEEPLLKKIGSRLIACHLGGLQTLLAARELSKTFAVDGSGPAGWVKRLTDPQSDKVAAVRRVSLDVYEGEVVALVGETGSGKTTLGRLLVGLEVGDGGQITFEEKDLFTLTGQPLKQLRRRIQFIAQDPFEAVSPLLTVAEIIREPLDVQRIGSPAEREAKVRTALQAVGLPTDPDFTARRSHELSGGQLQRIAIARALVLQPKLIVADEPVSMLDASEQAKVINLLKDIQSERGMGLLLISHELALVRKVADRILVMRDGEIVESGPTHRVVTQPQHAYTQALVRAAPAFHWDRRGGNSQEVGPNVKQNFVPPQSELEKRRNHHD